ncbi:MAG: POTRA domain-containing protein [Myxococcota bacterium]
MLPLLVSSIVVSSGTISGDALAPYRGQPVLSVDVEGPSEDEAEELRDLIDIQPGYLLASDDVEAALKRIYALGRFADVGVTAERLSGTISLYFYARPITRVVEIDIGVGVGADEIDTGALLDAIGLETGNEVDSRTPGRLARRTLNYLRRAGFPNATAQVDVAVDDEEPTALVRIRIDAGKAVRVVRVRFLGRPRLRRQVLRAMVETDIGDALDRNVLDADRERLLKAYRSHGFLRAVVGEPEIQIDGSRADVAFRIHAGDRIRVELYGNSLLTRADLMGLWAEPSDRLQRSDILIFRDRIVDAYRRLGYLRASVRVRERRNVGNEIFYYQLAINEGRPYRVTSIEFDGAETLDPKLLTDQVRAVLIEALRTDSFVERLDAGNRCLAFEPRLRPRDGAGARCPKVEVQPERRWVPEVYRDALEQITAAYRNLGFLSVRVGPPEPLFHTIEETTEIAVGEIRVRIPVVEGPQTVIETMAFRGNDAFGSADLLQTVAEAGTDADDDAVVMGPGAPFSAATIEDARIAIVRRYRDFGYLYAKIFTEVELSADRRTADVAFRCEEGPQVRIERILIRGNRYTRESIIRSRLAIKPGDLYRLDQVVKDRRAVAALGVFSSVQVKLIDEQTPGERKDLVTEVVERNRQRVEPFVGISSAEGPRAGVSYAHTNVFGTASTFTGSVRFNRQVFFGLYGEFGTPMRDRFADFGFLDQLGREIRTGIRSPRFMNLPLDPLARFDLVHDRTNAIPYSLDSNTAILGIDFSVFNRLTVSIEPQLVLSNLQCFEIAPALAGTGDAIGVENLDVEPTDTARESVANLLIRDETRCTERARVDQARARSINAGRRTTFKIGPSLSLDYRDNPLNPRRGFFLNAKATYAVGRAQSDTRASGSDPFSFSKVEGTVVAYLPTTGPVIALSARTGTINIIDGKIPIDERYYLGGRSTLRGFVDNTLIPEDAWVFNREKKRNNAPKAGRENIEQVGTTPPLTKGGNFFVVFKSEVQLPMTENFSLGLFVDVGNLWVATPAFTDLRLGDLRVTSGLGLRYNTPVGPLAFDVAFNTNPKRKRNLEPRWQPHFSVGIF